MSEVWELNDRRYSIPPSTVSEPRPLPPSHRSGSALLAASEDLHAWSIYRQNLNSDFTDSALGSQDRNPLPYGNFQLRESTVHSILSNPRYGPKSELGSNMYTYLKFGLPRVFPPAVRSREGSSGYDSSDDGALGGGKRRKGGRSPQGLGWPGKSKSNPDLLAPRELTHASAAEKRMKSSSEANLLDYESSYRGRRSTSKGLSFSRKLAESEISLASKKSRMHGAIFNQPPDSATYREPPILNDKLFPRDPPWNEDMIGHPFMGGKLPHLQLRGIVVETKVPTGGGWTPLLDGISIEVKGGEIMAVMTTSENEGTCLLDLLGGRSRKWGGRWRGDLVLNGNNVAPSKVCSRTAYVRQDVNFCPDMSVRQTMLLHSSLRECSDQGRVINIKAKINALIEDLGLEQVRHTRVKDLTLSERRRLNAACHLLLETDIVLLDQPTRGMDIFDTFFLVEYLRQWAARGRIVILTIQPPTYEIFTMISRVALISTGRLMYFGRRREMLPYFAFIEYPCPAYKNPSDYYIDLVTLDDLSAEAMLESSQRVEMLAETFRRRQEPLSDPGPPGHLPPKVKHSNLCIQLLFLWIRALIYQFPYNMLNFLGQAVVAAIISVIAGAVYLNLRTPAEMDQSNINNRVSFYYFMSCVGIWPLLLMTISEVWRDKLAVERDISDGLFSRAIYVITKLCYSFPTTVLVYLAYALPAYSMMAGFSGDSEESLFYLYVGYQLLYLLAARGLALGSTVIFDSRNRAAGLTALIMTVVALGAGFTVHPKDITLWASPTLWWSPARWFLREMVFEEFNRTTQPFTCSRNPVDRGDIVKKIECGLETSGQTLRYFALSDVPLSDKHNPALFIFIFNCVFIFIYIFGFILGKKPNRRKRYNVE